MPVPQGSNESAPVGRGGRRGEHLPAEPWCRRVQPRQRTAAAAIKRLSRFAGSSDGFGRSTRGGASRERRGEHLHAGRVLRAVVRALACKAGPPHAIDVPSDAAHAAARGGARPLRPPTRRDSRRDSCRDSRPSKSSAPSQRSASLVGTRPRGLRALGGWGGAHGRGRERLQGAPMGGRSSGPRASAPDVGGTQHALGMQVRGQSRGRSSGAISGEISGAISGAISSTISGVISGEISGAISGAICTCGNVDSKE